ncbi:MAG: threonine synthase [Ignavibacteria bacterium]|jgi:threonine synthase
MKFISTRKSKPVNYQTAVLKGLADDGGLYFPEELPKLKESFFKDFYSNSFQENSFEIAKLFFPGIPGNDLREVINSSINFPAPLVRLNENQFVLELFHGPTLAFKDFGARFMARLMNYINNGESSLNVLVATSGDTGSAVANGFYGIDGINVFLLYPSGKVSEIQEKQLTTYGKNVISLEIDGTFDDCQYLVKTAFSDKSINEKLNLTSANSINIARLIPQSFYYVEALKQLGDVDKSIIFSVPSGNLGNLTGGLLANQIGFDVNKFIAATNDNNVFEEYINSGIFTPRKSVKTLSNAMDVGNPSNLERIKFMFNDDIELTRKVIFSKSYSDKKTQNAIRDVYKKFNYVIDPHGAVAYNALNDYVAKYKIDNYSGIILETAHPAKFKDIVENTINKEVEIPAKLAECIAKEKKSIKLTNKYDGFRDFLLGQ